MFNNILKFIFQNIKNKTLIVSLILSMGYIFTPTLSYAGFTNFKCDAQVIPESKDNAINVMTNGSSGNTLFISKIGINAKCTYDKNNSPTSRGIFLYFNPAHGATKINNNTYESGVSGINVEYTIQNIKRPNGTPCPLLPNYIFGCPVTNDERSVGEFLIEFDIMYAIIKSDDKLHVGSFQMKSVSFDYLTSDTGQAPGTVTHSPRPTINLSAVTCTLNTPRIDFNLGSPQQTDFTHIGYTTTEKTQNIELRNCYNNIKYSLKIDGTPVPGHTDVLQLSSTGPNTATGVGVQLLANNRPIRLNTAVEMGTTASSGSDISVNIPLTARYYQTENMVKPGEANANATFTMTYE